MENRFYTGNQTHRPENTLVSRSFYNSTTNSQQKFTNYSHSQQQSMQPSGYNYSQQSPGQNTAQWWHSSGPFQPYRTTYQDYGPEKTLNYRTPNIHLTQPYFYDQRRGHALPPESEPHRLDFDVAPSLNGAHYS